MYVCMYVCVYIYTHTYRQGVQVEKGVFAYSPVWLDPKPKCSAVGTLSGDVVYIFRSEDLGNSNN